jgi:hypothetical protein
MTYWKKKKPQIVKAPMTAMAPAAVNCGSRRV